MNQDPHIRVVGWGPFRLFGERRRDELALQRARDDMLRARGSVDAKGRPVPIVWESADDRVGNPEPAASSSRADGGAAAAGVAKVTGKVVYDDLGQKIGSSADLYIDDRTGQPEWVTVLTGLFNSKKTFVPLRGADLVGDGIRVHVTKKQVARSPKINTAGHLTPEEEQELYRYYGLAVVGEGEALATGPREVSRGTETVASTDSPTGAAVEMAAAQVMSRAVGAPPPPPPLPPVPVERVRLDKETVQEQEEVNERLFWDGSR